MPFAINYESSTGKKVLFDSISIEEELITRWIEYHLGFSMTITLSNEHQMEKCNDRVRTRVAMSIFYRIEPKINTNEKIIRGIERSTHEGKM